MLYRATFYGPGARVITSYEFDSSESRVRELLSRWGVNGLERYAEECFFDDGYHAPRFREPELRVERVEG